MTALRTAAIHTVSAAVTGVERRHGFFHANLRARPEWKRRRKAWCAKRVARDQEIRRRNGYKHTDYQEGDYDRMFKAQDGRCGGCSVSGKTLVLEHCHHTNKIRGLTCYKCNHVLGQVDDDPEILRALIRYLESPPGVPREDP